MAEDHFTAYQEAGKVISAKKGSASRTASGDDVTFTGSRLATVVKVEPSSSSQGKKFKGGATTKSAQQSADVARSAGSLATALSNLNLKVFPQDGTVLPFGEPSKVVQVLQGGLLRTISQIHHFGEQLSGDGLATNREAIEDLMHQLSQEKDQCLARELEIYDLKNKVKDLEKTVETSSADALALCQKNQELEEESSALKAVAETFKPEMVMAVNGARIIARWELMREWLKKQSSQWE
ncbi:hypothetical protein Bca4012_026430 [Brassica carinata]